MKINHKGALESGVGLIEFNLNNFGNEDVNYEVSRLRLSKLGSNLDIEGDFFDDQVRFNSFIDLSSKQRSRIDLKVDVPELDQLLSVYHSELGGSKQVESQVSFLFLQIFC